MGSVSDVVDPILDAPGNIIEGAGDILSGDVSEGMDKIKGAVLDLNPANTALNEVGLGPEQQEAFAQDTYLKVTDPIVDVLDSIGLGGVGKTLQRFGPAIAAAYMGGAFDFGSATGAGLAEGGAMDMGVGLPEVAEGFGVTQGAGAGASLAEWAAGVSSSAPEFLLGESGNTTLAGAAPGAEGAVDWNAVGSGWEGAAADSAAQNAAMETAGAATTPPAGIIDKTMAFAKTNPGLTIAAGTLGAGAISGIGGYLAQTQAMKQRVAGDKELLAQKAKQEKELAEWKRKFIQGGSYFDAKLPFAPSTDGVLRRPDGTPVYGQNGLLNKAMA